MCLYLGMQNRPWKTILAAYSTTVRYGSSLPRTVSQPWMLTKKVLTRYCIDYQITSNHIFPIKRGFKTSYESSSINSNKYFVKRDSQNYSIKCLSEIQNLSCQIKKASIVI